MSDNDIITKFLRALAASFGAVSLVLFLFWFMASVFWSLLGIEMFDSLDQASSLLFLSIVAGGIACFSAAIATDSL